MVGARWSWRPPTLCGETWRVVWAAMRRGCRAPGLDLVAVGAARTGEIATGRRTRRDAARQGRGRGRSDSASCDPVSPFFGVNPWPRAGLHTLCSSRLVRRNRLTARSRQLAALP